MTIKSKDDMIARGIEIDLTGPDGNAFAVLGNARHWAKQLGLNWEAIEADATSGDYDHLVDVIEEHFGDYVTFYR